MSAPPVWTCSPPSRAPTARCSISPRWSSPRHLGASTSEAQDRAGTDVAESVKLALAGEFVPDAVNVAGGAVSETVAPWLELVRKLGVLAGVLATEAPESLTVTVARRSSEDVGVLKLALRAACSPR